MFWYIRIINTFKYTNCKPVSMNTNLLPKIIAKIKTACKKHTNSNATFVFQELMHTNKTKSIRELKQKQLNYINNNSDMVDSIIENALSDVFDKIKFTSNITNKLKEELLSKFLFILIVDKRSEKLLGSPIGIKTLIAELIFGTGIFKNQDTNYEIRQVIEKQWKLKTNELCKSIKK